MTEQAKQFTDCGCQNNGGSSRVFTDRLAFDANARTVVSVRDGVQEYLGAELGLEPSDKIFSVYRSPATIGNVAAMLNGLPLTDEHVKVGEPVAQPIGTISGTELIDQHDDSQASTIAIKNTVSLDGAAEAIVERGKRELSLGYSADFVPHEIYDYEQKNLQPHHLAIVPAGRCGSACSFLDNASDTTMKLHKAFLDEAGELNLEQVVEIAMQLPEALKTLPMEKLNEILPMLQEVVQQGKEGDAASAVEADETEAMAGEEATDMDGEEKAEDMAMEEEANDMEAEEKDEEKDFSDAIAVHTAIVVKARDFLDAKYEFVGKTGEQIMRDAIAAETKQTFTDAELPVAFKMLEKQSRYKDFGDQKPEADNRPSARILNSLED